MTYIFETSDDTFKGSKNAVHNHIIQKFNAIEISGSVCKATGVINVFFWDGALTSSGQKMWLTAGNLLEA